MIRCCILFDNLGPYHIARLTAASQVVNLVSIQGGSLSSTYAWNTTDGFSFPCININLNGPSDALPRREFIRRLDNAMEEAAPEVVFVPGWASLLALAAMKWANRRSIPVVMMSETTPWDEPRVFWREAIKRRLLQNASAALVGGSPHRQYLIQLGMNPQSIFDGYDVVDNDYFYQSVSTIRSNDAEDHFFVRDYILASNRFVEKKNLYRLLDAFSVHRNRTENSWDLCLLGDGPLRSELLAYCQDRELKVSFSAPWEKSESSFFEGNRNGTVYFPGFRQIDQLPLFYARARAFVHSSTTEQWGLVVNEAMASGLPVIVSNRCGCAEDLVVCGKAGWVFDPFDVDKLADLFDDVRAISDAGHLALSLNALRQISFWGPLRFATGVKSACENVSQLKAQADAAKRRWLDSVLISALCIKSR